MRILLNFSEPIWTTQCSLISHVWSKADICKKSYPQGHPLFHTLSSLLSPPFPSFSGVPLRKETLSILNMKCWNSAFNAQCSRVIRVVVRVGGSENICSSRRSGKRKEGTKLSFPPKLVRKDNDKNNERRTSWEIIFNQFF